MSEMVEKVAFVKRLSNLVQQNEMAFDADYVRRNGFYQPAYLGQKFTGPDGATLVAVPSTSD